MFSQVGRLFEPEEQDSLEGVLFPSSLLRYSPFATHRAGIPPVSTVHPENVGLHIGVPGEKLQTNSAGEFVLREGRCFKLRIFMMFLEFVCLK